MNVTAKRIALMGPILGALLTAFVLAAASPAPNVAATMVGLDSSLLSEADQDQLGFWVQPISVEQQLTTMVSVDAAVATSIDAFPGPTNGAQVMRAMAAPDASSAERPVIVVLLPGGEPLPGGPEGNGLHAVSYRGVVIDATSGKVLRMFAVGKL